MEVVVMAMMLVKALVTRGIMVATITVILVEVLEVMSEVECGGAGDGSGGVMTVM